MHYDLSPTKSIQENIHKARRAFFALGSIGAFHGRLNPLTGQSLFETFVIPTLLYGCETWILSEPLLESLESFQAEIGKRILGISKYHSNISTRIGLHWPSMKARILLRKLNFLANLLSKEDCLSSNIFQTLSSQNVYEINLVQQCRSLELQFGTNFLRECLDNPSEAPVVIRVAKADILARDWSCSIREAGSHPSLSIVCATDLIAASWKNMWDEALDFGVRSTKLMQVLFGSLSRPIFGDKLCPRCGVALCESYQEHLFSHHLPDKYSIDRTITWLNSRDHKCLFHFAEDISTLYFNVRSS